MATLAEMNVAIRTAISPFENAPLGKIEEMKDIVRSIAADVTFGRELGLDLTRGQVAYWLVRHKCGFAPGDGMWKSWNQLDGREKEEWEAALREGSREEVKRSDGEFSFLEVFGVVRI